MPRDTISMSSSKAIPLPCTVNGSGVMIADTGWARSRPVATTLCRRSLSVTMPIASSPCITTREDTSWPDITWAASRTGVCGGTETTGRCTISLIWVRRIGSPCSDRWATSTADLSRAGWLSWKYSASRLLLAHSSRKTSPGKTSSRVSSIASAVCRRGRRSRTKVAPMVAPAARRSRSTPFSSWMSMAPERTT